MTVYWGNGRQIFYKDMIDYKFDEATLDFLHSLRATTNFMRDYTSTIKKVAVGISMWSAALIEVCRKNNLKLKNNNYKAIDLKENNVNVIIANTLTNFNIANTILNGLERRATDKSGKYDTKHYNNLLFNDIYGMRDKNVCYAYNGLLDVNKVWYDFLRLVNNSNNEILGKSNNLAKHLNEGKTKLNDKQLQFVEKQLNTYSRFVDFINGDGNFNFADFNILESVNGMFNTIKSNFDEKVKFEVHFKYYKKFNSSNGYSKWNCSEEVANAGTAVLLNRGADYKEDIVVNHVGNVVESLTKNSGMGCN